MVGRDKSEAEREGQVGFQGEMRKLLGVMDIFIILLFVVWYTNVQAYQIIYFKNVVYCMSIRPQQSCLKIQ